MAASHSGRRAAAQAAPGGRCPTPFAPAAVVGTGAIDGLFTGSNPAPLVPRSNLSGAVDPRRHCEPEFDGTARGARAHRRCERAGTRTAVLRGAHSNRSEEHT